VAVPPRTGDAAFRPDLEGLRGIAILLVLLCHARIPGADGGFIGVDVFFVLSGFLITGLLVAEGERTGRIRLGTFYARRARRILPAAILVLASTLIAAQFVLSPLDLPRVGDDGIAVSLGLANVRFAIDATDYFAPVDASPMLHFWSLAVEEQFYLLWPLLLLAALRFGRPRRLMVGLAVSILLGSFALSLALTDAAAPWAYYSLPTRAWQLTAGGLLALAAPWLGRIPDRVAAVMGWAGVGLIIAATLVIGSSTAYPGLASLLPTAGALAIIASRGVAGSRGRFALGKPPFSWLGRISYSLYLWHWPVLVLGSVALGVGTEEDVPSDRDVVIRLGLILFAVLLAAITWRAVEEPFRRGRLLRGYRVRGFAMAGAAALILALASTTTNVFGERDTAAAAMDNGATDSDVAPGAPGEMSLDITSASVGSDQASVIDRARASSAVVRDEALVANPDPLESPAGASTSPSTAVPGPSPRITGALPRGLTPSLVNARADRDPLRDNGCGLPLGAGSRPPDCVMGDIRGSVTVALVGDSHAAHWFPAVDVVARRRGWRLVPFTKSSCVFVDMRIWSRRLNREYRECEVWRENVVDRLAKLRPDLVIIASAQELPIVVAGDDDPERQGEAMARLIRRIPGVVAIMADTPRSDYDVPACLAKHRNAIERCTTSRAAAFGLLHLRRETETARLTGATIVEMANAVCPGDPCPPIIGTTLVYRDHHHLTATFAVSIADQLEAALPFVAPAGRDPERSSMP
jgi:peptidoglycan/LPS O-acetylase OafA/YrhL